MEDFCSFFAPNDAINAFPLVVVTDDSDFLARTVENFVWVTFTRSDPAGDTYGIGSSTSAKHWGCSGALVIDARRKPHHAPPLEDDPEVEKRVDDFGAPGAPLHGII
jgi:4-hydroxy-3-polyprenylbenzoate decarboxylase